MVRVDPEVSVLTRLDAGNAAWTSKLVLFDFPVFRSPHGFVLESPCFMVGDSIAKMENQQLF